MELLLLAYVDINLDAVDCITKLRDGSTSPLPCELVRRVLLHFNRNDRCEKLVSSKFRKWLVDFSTVVGVQLTPTECVQCLHIDSELRDDLVETVTARISSHKAVLSESGASSMMVIACDDASSLIGRWNGLFSTADTSTRSVAPELHPAEAAHQSSCDGYHMLVEVGAELMKCSSFAVLCTGTWFSMDAVDRDCAPGSPSSTAIKTFCPKTLLATADMQSYLRNYFEDRDNVLENDAAVELLQRAVGRPFFFFNRIFRGTVSALGITSEKHHTLPLGILATWKERLDGEEDTWWNRSRMLLYNVGRSIPFDPYQTTAKLMVNLSVAMWSGTSVVKINELPLARAFIASGFAPNAVPFETTELPAEFKLEPMVEGPLYKMVRQLMRRVPNWLMYCPLPDQATRVEAGFIAEDAIMLDFCARTYIGDGNTISLFDLLEPLCPKSLVSMLEEKTRGWFTEACIPVDTQKLGNPFTELWDGVTVHSKKFLYNINRFMGPDIAFVAYRVNPAGERTFRLVVCRMKNRECCTAYEASSTLAAGAWFIGDHLRKAVAASLLPSATNDESSCPSNNWIELCEWLAEAPEWLRQHCIRVAFTANADVDEDSLSTLSDASGGEIPEELSSHTVLEAAPAGSPLFVLSMKLYPQ